MLEPITDSLSRIRATPGPLPLWRCSNANLATVVGPQTPSGVIPEFRWKSTNALIVAGPRMPSGRPQSNPR